MLGVEQLVCTRLMLCCEGIEISMCGSSFFMSAESGPAELTVAALVTAGTLEILARSVSRVRILREGREAAGVHGRGELSVDPRKGAARGGRAGTLTLVSVVLLCHDCQFLLIYYLQLRFYYHLLGKHQLITIINSHFLRFLPFFPFFFFLTANMLWKSISWILG